MAFDYNTCEHRFGNTRCDRRRRSVSYSAKCATCKMRVRAAIRKNASGVSVVIYDALGIVLAFRTVLGNHNASDLVASITQSLTNSVRYQDVLSQVAA